MTENRTRQSTSIVGTRREMWTKPCTSSSLSETFLRSSSSSAFFGFIAKQGLGVLISRFDVAEFFTSKFRRPTSETNPTYGALALIAGTASVTGTAMIAAELGETAVGADH